MTQFSPLMEQLDKTLRALITLIAFTAMRKQFLDYYCMLETNGMRTLIAYTV